MGQSYATEESIEPMISIFYVASYGITVSANSFRACRDQTRIHTCIQENLKDSVTGPLFRVAFLGLLTVERKQKRNQDPVKYLWWSFLGD